jgi:hypothetical protein
MPNHVTNHLSFNGEESKIKELLKGVKGDKYEFEIDAYYPIPSALRNTVSPSKIVSNEELKDWNRRKKEKQLTDWELMYKPMTERRSKELIKKYGADNWYDWCCNNWGSKWGAYGVDKIDDYTFSFLSAWSTPISAMVVLSKYYPDVEIAVKYFDEDFGANVGEYTLLAGKIIYINQPEDFSEEAYRLAIDIDGSDRYYTDDLVDIDEEDNIEHTYISTCIKLAHERGTIYKDFPAIVLNKLLELAVASEKYEQAALIKKYIENPISK